ncbi:MAG: tetratricopeptide repeat protein [Bacteroidota bacterium]
MKAFPFVGVLVLVCCLSFCAHAQEGIKDYNKGMGHMSQGQFQQALASFHQGIERNDIAKSVNHYGRAYAQFELGNLEEAQADIAQSLLTEPINAEDINSAIYWLRGMLANAMGDVNLEVESYEKALLYTPKENRLKTTLGFAYIQQQSYEKALTTLTEALQADDADAYAYNNRALAHLKMGQLKKAKSDLEHSKAIDPDNPFLYKHYFFYHQQLGEQAEACQALGQALGKKMGEYGEASDTEELLSLQKAHCGS